MGNVTRREGGEEKSPAHMRRNYFANRRHVAGFAGCNNGLVTFLSHVGRSVSLVFFIKGASFFVSETVIIRC